MSIAKLKDRFLGKDKDADEIQPEAPKSNIDFPERSSFRPDIFSELPGILGEVCRLFPEGEPRAAIFQSTITIISAAISNGIYGFYDGSKMRPNLYCYLLGNAGSGKGVINQAYKLGLPIQEQIDKDIKEAYGIYNEQLIQYNKELEDYKKDKTPTPPYDIPVEPEQKAFYIPGNSTASAILSLLATSGNGCIFESEADSISAVMKSEMGNYTDILRKAFHHEGINLNRRANRERINVNGTALSVMISSTHGQLHKLIPNSDDGTLQRFLFYEFEGETAFRNVFKTKGDELNTKIEEYARKIKALYDFAQKFEREFVFTEAQGNKFYEKFLQLSDKYIELGDYFSGMVRRLGLSAYRIAMVLTYIFSYESFYDKMPEKLTCTNTDFDLALEIIDVFYTHTVNVYINYPKQKTVNAGIIEYEIIDNEDAKLQTYQLYNEGHGYKRIAKELNQKPDTVKKWIQRARKKGEIELRDLQSNK